MGFVPCTFIASGYEKTPGFVFDACVEESSFTVDLITFNVIAGRDIYFSAEDRHVIVKRCCDVADANAGVVFLFFLVVVFIVIVVCLEILQMYECWIGHSYDHMLVIVN